MPTFGFSAFLKLVCLNDRPQRTEVRNRIAGRSSGGYDYHRSLKRLANAVIEQGLSLEEVLARADAITKDSERASATRGLSNLGKWLECNRNQFLKFEPTIYVSPAKFYTVKFMPDFGQLVGSRGTAIHIWNNATPVLSDNLVRMALSLVSGSYLGQEGAPQDLGVLDLPKGRLILLSEATLVPNSGIPLATRLDRLFETVKIEIGEKGEKPTDRPSAPPPP